MSEMPSVKQIYMLVREQDVPLQGKLDYWGEMEKANTLRFRWGDMLDVTPISVISRCQGTSGHYFVVDINQKKIIAEFALESFTGKAAQIHFSMSPDNPTKISLYLATYFGDLILNEWKDDVGEPYLETLFGLTPVLNRVATSFIKKAGFRVLGILPNGTKHLNQVCDAVLTIKERI